MQETTDLADYRLGVLVGTAAHAPLQGLLQQPSTVACASVAELRALVDNGSIDAVLVDPEVDDAWPLDIAAEIMRSIGPKMPTLFICRTERDAQLIESRVLKIGGIVVRYDQASTESVGAIVRGDLAKRRARQSPH